jgi:hypothetical protein
VTTSHKTSGKKEPEFFGPYLIVGYSMIIPRQTRNGKVVITNTATGKVTCHARIRPDVIMWRSGPEHCTTSHRPEKFLLACISATKHPLCSAHRASQCVLPLPRSIPVCSASIPGATKCVPPTEHPSVFCPRSNPVCSASQTNSMRRGL